MSRPAPWMVLIIEPRSGPDCVPEEFLKHLEQHKCLYHRVHDVTQACTLLRSQIPGAVLLNPAVAEGDPMKIYEVLRPCAPQVPYILLLRPDQKEIGGQMVASGVSDYFIHGTYDAWKLEKRIRREIAAAQHYESLQNEANLLNALLDSIPDRIYFKDRDSRFIRCSRALAEFVQVADPSEVVGWTDADFFPKDQAVLARTQELQIMETGQPLVNQVEQKPGPGGVMTWALTTKVPFRNPAGRIIGTLGISRDITELQNMQAALAEERALLRTLIDALPDSIYIKDTESRFLLANRSCARIMGAEGPDALVGYRDHDFYPPEYADAFRADEVQVLKTGEPILEREEQVACADGKVIWMLTSKLPFRDNEGRIAGILGIGRDITRFRLLEEELGRIKGVLV